MTFIVITAKLHRRRKRGVKRRMSQGPSPFSRVEIGALPLGVLIGTLVAGDGRAHWVKGVQLVAFYLILAAMFYLIPA
jgi:hypothetical protein